MTEMQENGELETVSEEIEKEQESVEQQGQQDQQAQQQQDDGIPEKYKGKSIKEIIAELEVANQNMGRYANELGEVRKLADSIIKASLQKSTNERESQPEINFFENPEEAIRRAVESNPKVREVEQYAISAQQELAKQRLMQLHPDFMKVLQDKSFQDWIGDSPVRKQLFMKANAYDVDVANELFSTFKELKASRNAQISSVEKKAREKAMNSAAVDTGGSGETAKKIYSRAWILKKMANPKEYTGQLKREIELAYAEGRVRG